MIVPAAHVAAAHTVVARPEKRTTIRVGDVIVFPLYDSRRPAMYYGTGLRRLGVRNIGPHDLWNDMRLRPPASWHMTRAVNDAASNRGEAFAAIRRGSGSVNVLLLLPRMSERCVSCRTIHYFFTVVRE